ncbi:restriction endonuclease subunit S [Acetobacter thailandicus]|uniref:restriction endonuclease subunit S n=1 Tax=Acetobacter thailandicus TaxID=1502842 RepID=UPI001BA79BA1|nr:restriction endonuclease subunit S [Acetobacter thailandicus]
MRHWNVVPLKNLIQIQNGEDHKEFEQNEGIPVLGSGGHFSYASKWLYYGESVLFGRKGTIDKPLYIKGKFWAVDTMFWSKIFPVTFGKFIYYSSLIIPFGYYSNSTAFSRLRPHFLR